MDKAQAYLEHVQKLLKDRAAPQLNGEIAENPLLRQIHDELISIRETSLAFSAGNFDPVITARGVIPGCLKSIQANLRHLSWQVQEVGKGDFSQRVNFMGEFSAAFNDMVVKLSRSFARELQLLKMNLMVKAAGLCLWDMDVRHDNPVNPVMIFNWSKNVRHMLGYEDENDFPNELSSMENILHQEDRERIIELLHEHLNDKTGQTPFNIECRMRKKNGEYIFVSNSAETLRDKAGNPVHTSGAMQDITPLKNLILEADKQRQEAVKANMAKSVFLNTMSHEIRTPLNAILGIADILLYKENLPVEVSKSIGIIHASGDLLLGLINNVLDISRIEAGKLELENNIYELASLISDTVQLNSMRTGSKPIDLEVDVDENLPSHLIGDQLRIKQILNNLLSNAIKYTESGTVRLTVAPGKCNANEEVLVITVSDTGQGMSKEQLKILFEKYVRFNETANRYTEGTGLGMPITQNLVQLMGGEITVESEPGKGSVFTVCLPQTSCGAGCIGKETVENLKQFRTCSLKRMKQVQISRELMPYGKILIVDDVETNIYVARGLMAPYELNIDSVTSGPEAIEKIKAGNVYDIIFMDYMMPEMNGIETARHIMDMGYKNPIIALTANAISGQENIFLDNGFADFITKPVDIRQLNMVLNKFVRDKHFQAAAGLAQNLADSPVNSEIDPLLAEAFLMDAHRSLAVMDDLLKGGLAPDSEELRLFTVHIHGMKSALSNIGKIPLSSWAMKLEKLSRSGDADAVSAETPAFIAALRAFMSEIAPAKNNMQEMPDAEEEDRPFLYKQLEKISSACEEYDDLAIEQALKELKTRTWHKNTNKLLEAVSEQLLLSGFDKIRSLVSRIHQNTA